ncbi:hypothetical protein PFISCL1PPCAC_3725, partial [Pristionchus fissidentatus]
LWRSPLLTISAMEQHTATRSRYHDTAAAAASRGRQQQQPHEIGLFEALEMDGTTHRLNCILLTLLFTMFCAALSYLYWQWKETQKALELSMKLNRQHIEKEQKEQHERERKQRHRSFEQNLFKYLEKQEQQIREACAAKEASAAKSAQRNERRKRRELRHKVVDRAQPASDPPKSDEKPPTVDKAENHADQRE